MRICFFGDSFVNGTGDDDCLGWPGRLCADARARSRDVTLYNLGIRRDTSADVRERWEREAAARLLPAHKGGLVFSFGVNDCILEAGRLRVPEETSVAHARTILSRATTMWPTLMIGPPCTSDADLDNRVRLLSNRLELLCSELSVPFLPLFRRTGSAEVWRRETGQGDGIHPNRGGYALVCDAVLGWQPWRDWID